MRALFLIIILIFIFTGPSVLPAELNSLNRNSIGLSNNNNELFPYGFILLKNGTFDDLMLNIYEEWELDQLLGSNIKWAIEEFDWLKWLDSRNKVGSRALLGGLPFFSIPKHSRQDDEVRDPAFISTDKFLFFWYFKQKF
jgi:hypothetical protein